jgi:hypothetical protein
MVRRSFALALGAVCVLVLVACGPPEVKDDFYSAEDTRECLEDEGFRVTTSDEEVGVITAAATGGGFRAYIPGGGNSLTIAFGNTKEEAQQMVKAFENATRTRHERRRLGSLLEGQGNAVLVWITEAPESDKERVRDCLT